MDAKRVFTNEGAEVDSVNLLQDGMKLLVSEQSTVSLDDVIALALEVADGKREAKTPAPYVPPPKSQEREKVKDKEREREKEKGSDKDEDQHHQEPPPKSTTPPSSNNNPKPPDIAKANLQLEEFAIKVIFFFLFFCFSFVLAFAFDCFSRSLNLSNF